MSDNLHQRLALFSSLDCKIARRFNDRPTLLDAAEHMLLEQWQLHLLDSSLDPLSLYLASSTAETGKAWVRPLGMLLVERFCRRTTLNLTPGEDRFSTHPDAADGHDVVLDLHSVEQLVNEAGPLLLATYQHLLVGYWSRFDSSGQTPWQWYADYLRAQLAEAIASHARAASLPPFALAAARLVHDHPSPTLRQAWQNTATRLQVSVLGLDFSRDRKLDVDLASALLIEYTDGDPQRDLLLLYTLGGKLLRFASRHALGEAIARYWPSAALSVPRQLSIAPNQVQDFETQALGLLQQQLRVVEQLAGQYHSEAHAIALCLDIDRFSSMVDLCSEDETRQRQTLAQHLPKWLRDAASRPLMHYGRLLIDIAQGYEDVHGQFWLDGIDTAEDYAYRQLAARFAADHPQQPLEPRQVRVINHQTIAAAAAGQGVVFGGAVQAVEFSLAQLAIGNLGLLKPGRIELRSAADDPGQALPAWFDEAYLRRVIGELDIATAYPAMLRRQLLDDSGQRQRRERLLGSQLSRQLPALAMELFLRGAFPERSSVEHVAEVFSTDRPGLQRWIMRPLGLIKAPGSPVDHPRNTWLLEPLEPVASPCVLYRPLHEQPLVHFADRLALFSAISNTGALQEDLLQRLPADTRRFYAHGGFLEPHLFQPLDDTSAVPFATPAPVSLAVEAPVANLAQTLYLACVNESIAGFQAHASSTAQTRWERWKSLGWLLFNTLLPLAGSTLGKAAWLAQMELALVDYVNSDGQRDPLGQRLAMVNLLVNVAMLLFSHSLFRLRLEQAEAHPAPPAPAPAATAVRPVLTDSVAEQIDFSWARPDRRLDTGQQSALLALQSSLPLEAVGAPIPSGPLRGLYLVDTLLYVVLDSKVYRAALDEQRNQMRILGPDASPGPWLHHDEIGRWRLDLALALKGGMPLARQLRKLRLQREEAMREANAQIVEDKQAIAERNRELTTVDKLAASSDDDNLLASCQARVQAISQFWHDHLAHLKARNALEPVKSFKPVHAYALYQDSYCQRVLHNILRKRYQPARQQLLQLAREQPQGIELTPADVRIASQHLDAVLPLLDAMLDNHARLRECQDELAKLASQRHPDIMQWRDLAASVSASADKALVLRYLRLECLLNRLAMVHGLSPDGLYWRERFWANFELAIAQRAKLLQLGSPDEEMLARLLRSIQAHFQAAQRQLGHLAEHVEEDAARQTLNRVEQELGSLQAQLASDIAELPDYPQTHSLAQLRSKLPGLIETRDHGLLLAEPRADDAATVDIPGPDNKTPTRTYHLKHGDWVELEPARPAVAAPRHTLKRLLKEADGLLASARAETDKLQRQQQAYLPVEIEEAVLHQRSRLLAQVQAIETRLTEANQTDQAVQGKDAEQVAAALRRLAEQLQHEATALRTSAALAQKPRMGEVQFLLEQGQVQISRVGSRTRLARVKGRPLDYLDEYSISHAGTVLWYAHFHYPALDTAAAEFTAGHLKTAAQRHLTAQRGSAQEVYRAPISVAAARQYFFAG